MLRIKIIKYVVMQSLWCPAISERVFLECPQAPPAVSFRVDEDEFGALGAIG
jgi:hypothetical protein